MIRRANEVNDDLPNLAVGHLSAQTITLAASDGRPRIAIAADEDGGASLGMNDLQGALRISVGIDANGLAHIALLDHEQRPRLKAFVSGDTPFLSLMGSDGRPRWILTLDETDSPAVAVFDKDGALANDEKDQS